MIDSRLNTTVQATLNLRDVAQLPIVLPPQGERERIAHILGTLDDKIELNRRMNETLEAMARALFKSWFVDFDPVRAKSEGRLPAGRQATPAWPRQGQWCVYALECEDGSFYIGHTENLERRFEDHSQGKGADWTRRHPPKRVAYWEGTATQAAAIERERKLKSGSGREWLKLEIARRDLASGRLSKPPCLPNRQVADLFPDSFEDSALGEIPKGWEVKGLDEIARFVNGLALQKFPPVGERSLPVIKIAQLRAGNTTSADRASAELEPDYIVQDGDILFSWSGSLECVLWAGGAGALNQHLFKVTSTTHPRWLCYLGIHQHLHDFRHVAAGKATTMGHIQRRHLSDAMIAVPPEPLLRAASLLLEPMMDLLWKRNVESRTLGALRDTLLPKLISGELRLSDTERFTEEATA